VRANFEAETQIAKMEDVYFDAVAQARTRASAAAA
jgi:hypothetical protein